MGMPGGKLGITTFVMVQNAGNNDDGNLLLFSSIDNFFLNIIILLLLFLSFSFTRIARYWSQSVNDWL
jgi:hypothetical protein